jgi:hypothetical protein
MKGKTKDKFNHGLSIYTKNYDITFESIMDEMGNIGSCDEAIREFKKIVSIYGVKFGDIPFSDIMMIILKEKKWLDWLLKNDFITKNSIANVQVGDVFTLYGVFHMLIKIDDKTVCLVNLENGESTDQTNVDDSDDIVEEEKLFEIFDLLSNQEKELQEIIESRISWSKLKISKNGKK